MQRNREMTHSVPTKAFPQPRHFHNQGISTAKPRGSHAVCTLRVHPPASPCPTLSADTEHKSQGHCRKWHHKLKICWIQLKLLVFKRLMLCNNCVYPMKNNSWRCDDVIPICNQWQTSIEWNIFCSEFFYHNHKCITLCRYSIRAFL